MDFSTDLTQYQQELQLQGAPQATPTLDPYATPSAQVKDIEPVSDVSDFARDLDLFTKSEVSLGGVADAAQINAQGQANRLAEKQRREEEARAKAEEQALIKQEEDMRADIEAYRSARGDVRPEDIAAVVKTNGQSMQGGVQRTILGKGGVVTQKFGNKSAVEKYSGGVNYGTDIAVPKGTPVAVPPGKWQVVEAFDKATAEGPNNRQGGINRGYGNSVLVKNVETGELMRFSHLSQVGVRPGQTIEGGAVFGKTGATGNVAGRTGQHLDLEYYDSRGRVSDVLKTPYARFLL